MNINVSQILFEDFIVRLKEVTYNGPNSYDRNLLELNAAVEKLNTIDSKEVNLDTVTLLKDTALQIAALSLRMAGVISMTENQLYKRKP